MALLNPIADGQNLIPLITARAQLEALRVLAAAPPDIEKKVDICLKVHPSYNDLGIITAASEDLPDKALPPESDLEQLLEETDLFVAVNYMGSALVPVLLAGKPCIYLLTESQVMLARPDWNLTLLMEGTTLVRNGHDLWHTIRAFDSDPDVKFKMELKSRQYSEKYLDTSRLPTMPELIKELLPVNSLVLNETEITVIARRHHMGPAVGSLARILWDDWRGKRFPSVSTREHLAATQDWILAAHSATRRQGISASFSLLSGWARIPGDNRLSHTDAL